MARGTWVAFRGREAWRENTMESKVFLRPSCGLSPLNPQVPKSAYKGALTWPWAVVPNGAGEALSWALASFCDWVGMLRACLGGFWVGFTHSRAGVARRAGFPGLGFCRVRATLTFLPKHGPPGPLRYKHLDCNPCHLTCFAPLSWWAGPTVFFPLGSRVSHQGVRGTGDGFSAALRAVKP